MDLQINLNLIDDKIKFRAGARSNPELIIDYFPPVGNGQGYTSLELLLASFSYCVGTTLLTLFRHKIQKHIGSLKIIAGGKMKEDHPRSLSSIDIEMEIGPADRTNEEVKQQGLALNKVFARCGI